jgi:sarcosine oxidase, subunit gamma
VTADIVFLRRAFALIENVEIAQYDLRLDPSLAHRLPFALPTEPNAVVETPGVDAMWLGPDEWLVVTGAEGIDVELDGVHHSWVDVSANRVALDLAGDRTMPMLATGCSIDLHPRAWRERMCAQTLLGRAPVILQHRGDTQRIFVRPSYLNYLVEWMRDAVE